MRASPRFAAALTLLTVLGAPTALRAQLTMTAKASSSWYIFAKNSWPAQMTQRLISGTPIAPRQSFQSYVQNGNAMAGADYVCHVQGTKLLSFAKAQATAGFGTVGHNSPGGPGFNDTLMTLTASAPWTGCLQVDRYLTLTGTPDYLRHQVQIDIGNDGSFELIEDMRAPRAVQTDFFSLSFAGPGSVQIRIRQELSMTVTSSPSRVHCLGHMVLKPVQPNQATYSVSGNGCPWSGGTPSLKAAGGARPKFGSPFSAVIDNMPPNAMALGIFGLSNTGSVGGLSLPIELSLFGMPSCTLYTDIAVTEPLMAGPTGSAVWRLVIPDDCNLASRDFYQQVMVLASGANPAGAVLSNLGVGRVGL